MKCKFKIFVCLLVFFIMYNYDGYGQTKDTSGFPKNKIESPSYTREDSVYDLNDTGNVNISLDDSDKIAKWKQSHDFAYIHYLDSLLRKQKNIKSDTVSINENSGMINRNYKPDNEVLAINKILNSIPLKILFWLLALIFIAFVGYRVLIKNGIFTIKKKKLITESEEELSPGLNDLSRYDELISGAENNNNFNLATRYLYLKTLKNLSEKGVINFAPDKTNLDYLNEMRTNSHFEEFQLLTRNYEYLWYGKFLIDEKSYMNLKDRFNLFNKRV